MAGDSDRLSRWHVLRMNIAVFFGLLLAAYLAIPLIGGIRALVRPLWPKADYRVALPNYKGVEWAARHFAEMNTLKTDYMSYYGWRRWPFAGSTITVEPGLQIRHTPQTNASPGKPRVYFFGGSTMWGTGSDDAHTIPSLYQQQFGGTVLNFGESGWVAHQSLNQLMKLYTEGHRPDVVVFYDGVNEVQHKCRREVDFWADDRQGQIRQALAYRPTDPGYYLRPILDVAGLAAQALETRRQGELHDCDRNPAKATLIAAQLIADWQIAATLVQAHGGRFYAFLQPVAYFGRPRLDHLRLPGAMGNQYRAVYPLIRDKMAQAGIGADITDMFDGDEYIYNDFSHVSPNGNARAAARIGAAIAR